VISFRNFGGSSENLKLAINYSYVICLQSTVGGASSAEKHKQKPRQMLKTKSMNRAEEKAAKIRQLHKQNSLYYLSYKSEVADAGESLCVCCLERILVTFWLIDT